MENKKIALELTKAVLSNENYQPSYPISESIATLYLNVLKEIEGSGDE